MVIADFVYDGRTISPIKYLPELLQPIQDFQGLNDAYKAELKDLYEACAALFDDQFISTASETILTKWENHLGILPNATDTLDERRFRILAKLNDTPPYTERYLKNKLVELCSDGEFELEIDIPNYTVRVGVTVNSPANTETINAWLSELLPANLLLIVYQILTRHYELYEYTHDNLAKYTHNQIKYREVFSQETT